MWNIAERSGCGFELNLDELRIPEIVSSTATANDFDPLNLLFCWGDWNVVITVAPSSIEEFLVTTRAEGISAMRLGHAIAGPAHLAAVTRGKRYELALLRNENFTRSSYNADVSDQLKFMLQTPLLKRQLPPDSLPSTCADEMPPE
jgi:thiamine monophosphate kinase